MYLHEWLMNRDKMINKEFNSNVSTIAQELPMSDLHCNISTRAYFYFMASFPVPVPNQNNRNWECLYFIVSITPHCSEIQLLYVTFLPTAFYGVSKHYVNVLNNNSPLPTLARNATQSFLVRQGYACCLSVSQNH